MSDRNSTLFRCVTRQPPGLHLHHRLITRRHTHKHYFECFFDVFVAINVCLVSGQVSETKTLQSINIEKWRDVRRRERESKGEWGREREKIDECFTCWLDSSTTCMSHQNRVVSRKCFLSLSPILNSITNHIIKIRSQTLSKFENNLICVHIASSMLSDFLCQALHLASRTSTYWL